MRTAPHLKQVAAGHSTTNLISAVSLKHLFRVKGKDESRLEQSCFCVCSNVRLWGYYVGTYRGYDVHKRWAEHKTGDGSRFCRRYPPIAFKLVGRFLRKNAFKYEHALTVYYMRKCGFRYCRGARALNMQNDCHRFNNLYWVPKELSAELKAGKLGLWDDLSEHPLVTCV
jgi:predicted GIY-YIG superfamily endonuclease